MADRGQERPFGAKASETTTHRVIKSIDERLLGRIRDARAGARACVGCGCPAGHDYANLDGTLMTTHSEKTGGWQATSTGMVSSARLLA